MCDISSDPSMHDTPRGSCQLVGHAVLGCNGDTDPELHRALCQDGIGFGRNHGEPAGVDRDVVRDEFHLADPRAG